MLEIHEGIEPKVAFDSWDQNEEFYRSFQSDENVSIKKVKLRNEEIIKITIHERVKTLPLLIAKSPKEKEVNESLKFHIESPINFMHIRAMNCDYLEHHDTTIWETNNDNGTPLCNSLPLHAMIKMKPLMPRAKHWYLTSPYKESNKKNSIVWLKLDITITSKKYTLHRNRNLFP